MDRNTIIGLVLIGALLLMWSIFNQPSATELAQQKHIQDSIALVKEKSEKQEAAKLASAPKDSATLSSTDTNKVATAVTPVVNAGYFIDSTVSHEDFLTLENDVMKVTLSNKGGKVHSVELKKYKTFDGKPMVLFEESSNKFEYVFFTGTNQVNTGNIYFKAESQSALVTGKDSATIHYRAYLSADRYIEQNYTIRDGSYMLGYKLNLKGLDSIIAQKDDYFTLVWKQKLLNGEHTLTDNRNYSTVSFKYPSESASSLSTSADATEKLTTFVDWISFKQHFFNSCVR